VRAEPHPHETSVLQNFPLHGVNEVWFRCGTKLNYFELLEQSTVIISNYIHIYLTLKFHSISLLIYSVLSKVNISIKDE
jgi:hypothetical protein